MRANFSREAANKAFAKGQNKNRQAWLISIIIFPLAQRKQAFWHLIRSAKQRYISHQGQGTLGQRGGDTSSPCNMTKLLGSPDPPRMFIGMPLYAARAVEFSILLIFGQDSYATTSLSRSNIVLQVSRQMSSDWHRDSFTTEHLSTWCLAGAKTDCFGKTSLRQLQNL